MIELDEQLKRDIGQVGTEDWIWIRLGLKREVVDSTLSLDSTGKM